MALFSSFLGAAAPHAGLQDREQGLGNRDQPVWTLQGLDPTLADKGQGRPPGRGTLRIDPTQAKPGWAPVQWFSILWAERSRKDGARSVLGGFSNGWALTPET